MNIKYYCGTFIKCRICGGMEIGMTQKIIEVLKTMVISYIITAVMLLLLALGLYKLGLSEWQVTAGIIITYAISVFVGGYCLARRQRTGKMLWGIGFGIVYCAVLVIVSLAISRGVSMDVSSIIRAAVVSVCAGAIGAFASPVTRQDRI